MTAGANFEIADGRVLWWNPLATGDVLIAQDHEARMRSRQGTYIPYSEYGNPFVKTMSSEISITERNMRLISETKECALQDPRLIDAIVDEDSITDIEGTLEFSYQLIRADGGTIQSEFSSDLT